MMNKRIDKLLKRASNHFNEWDNIFQEYALSCCGERYIDDDKYLDIYKNTSDVFSQLLKNFIEYGKYQDKFHFNEYYPNIYGVESIVTSEKLECEFILGTNNNAYFLQSYVLHPEHIKNMDDIFWRDLLALNQYGSFEFVENAWVQGAEKSEIERILKNTKSNMIRLLKNYLLLNIHNGDLTDIGWLRVNWPINTYWDDLLLKGCEAFKTLYKINYTLWRIQYIRSKKKSQFR